MKDIIKIILFAILAIFLVFIYDTYIRYSKEMSIPLCTDEQIIISDWGLCTDSIQEREIRYDEKACRIDENVFPKKQSCTPSISIGATSTWSVKTPRIKRVSIFDWAYTTEVNIEKWDYSKSYNNFSITLSGSIKSLKLYVLWETQVNGWKRIFIPESYYYMFSINDSIPRILWTTRKAQNRIDTTWEGVFKWTETPKRLNFDLSNAQLSPTSDEYLKWKKVINRNYIKILNENNWKRLNWTLLMWDWNSMLEPDILNRIFWIISEAYIEYECSDWTDCSIKIQ